MERRKTSGKTVEERLQPWIDQGEYVIALTIAIMAWAAGWIDLLGNESPSNPDILGRYALPLFIVIVIYTLGFIFWFWLIGSLKAIERLKRVIGFIQRNLWLYILMWMGFIGIIWTMFNVDYWSRLPLLQIAVLIYMLLFTALVLLTKPSDEAPFQLWRKIAIFLIVALVLLEVSLQGMASMQILPFNNTDGTSIPYGRVYQTEEGFANANTNSFGWYYPDFRLDDGSQRILLAGDTFVEALQIPFEAHMGLQLESLLRESDDTPIEVIAQGQPGYGATFFLNSELYTYILEPMSPNEVIVLFHLANDFQIPDSTLDPRPKYEINASGELVIVEDDFGYWHTLAHFVIAGHDPVIPIRTIASNLMTFQLAENVLQVVGFSLERPEFALNINQATAEQPFGPTSFMFETTGSDLADQTFELASALLQQYAEDLAEQGISVRFVTIPFFPEAFYAQSDNDEWAIEFDDYDTLLPEQRLQEVATASDIPFLGMGQYLQSSGLSLEVIRTLFFNDGFGHLTELGHAQFAEAIHACFYDASTGLSIEEGCVTSSD